MCNYAHLPKGTQAPATLASFQSKPPHLKWQLPSCQLSACSPVSSGWGSGSSSCPIPCWEASRMDVWPGAGSSPGLPPSGSQVICSKHRMGRAAPVNRCETRTLRLPTAAFESDLVAFPLPSSSATGEGFLYVWTLSSYLYSLNS